MLLDPTRAQELSDAFKKYVFTDILSELFGDAPSPYMTDDFVAVIPVYGVIGKDLSPIERLMGGVDVNDVSRSIDKMLASGARKIAFQINSPGGTVTGVEELASKIAGLNVPTMAYSDGMMASAAYWIGSQADRVVVSPSSTIGSVGVYQIVDDYSKALEDAGIKRIVIKAGEHKAAGLEGTSLSKAQQDMLQSGVDEIWQGFKAAILSKRKFIKPEDMEGQTFSGRMAAQKGLATGMANSFEIALASF